MTLTIAVLKSWQPGRLDTISDKLAKERKALVDLQDELDAGRPPSDWQGDDASAARTKHQGLYDRLVDLVAETTAVVNALDSAHTAIKAAKESMEGAISSAEAAGYTVDADGSISDPKTYTESEMMAEQHSMTRRSQLAGQISDALQDAADADSDLAAVLNTAAVGAYDVSGRLDNALNADDLRGKSPEELATWLLDNPDQGATMLPMLSPEVRQELGEQLADLTRGAMDWEKELQYDPEKAEEYLATLNRQMDAYGTDPVVSTAFLEDMGPRGLVEFNAWLPSLQLDDNFPEGYDEDRPFHEGLAGQMGDLQRNLGEMLNVGTRGLTGDGQPATDDHVSSQWVQDLVGAGDDQVTMPGLNNHYGPHKMWGYQLLAPMLHDADSHYLLTEVGDGMIRFETEYAREHGASPWNFPITDEDGRVVGGRTDGSEWTEGLDGLRLDWTSGTGEDDHAGFDPMGALLDGLSNNPDAARDFLTGEDVPVEYRTDDGSEVRDRSRLNYLLTDRDWMPDHPSYSQVHNLEAYGPSNIAYLGDALESATMDGTLDEGDRTQIRGILEETVHSLATDEAVRGHDNRDLGDDSTRPFRDMDWIDPALRDPLANILGHHSETLHLTMESVTSGPVGPYGVDWDAGELSRVLADIGKDPSAAATVREAEYAEAIHQLNSRLPEGSDDGQVAQNVTSALGRILGPLDYGAVESSVSEGQGDDADHNQDVSDKAGLAREVVGLIPTGKNPIVGLAADAGFESLISAWEKANQVDHIGDRNYSTGEVLVHRQEMTTALVEEVLRRHGAGEETIRAFGNDAASHYAQGFDWAGAILGYETSR